jgi:glycosyltransferase involved in cell wall biosynthesis
VVVRGSELLDGEKSGSLTKKKILIFSDWFEPGYRAGGPIRSAKYFVDAMSDLYTISVITSDTDLGESKPYADIRANHWTETPDGTRIYYARKKTLNSRVIRRLIHGEKPDIIYLNSMYSFKFSILPLLLLWRKRIHATMILSPRGMLRESAIKTKTKRKRLFISLLNRLQIPKKIRFHATDAQEKKDIHRYFPKAHRVELIPNFSAPLPTALAPIRKIPGKLRLVFISRIMRIKNILFFLKLLNKISEKTEIEFSIYGDIEDAMYWEESHALIQLLPRNITASWLGSLPNEKVNTVLEANHFFVLPTTGENFGHAIFESFSAGRPVLISNKTPWLGLREKEIGWDLSLDDPDQWVAAIEEAAAFDQSVFDHWSACARRFAMEYRERTDLKADYIKLFS